MTVVLMQARILERPHRLSRLPCTCHATNPLEYFQGLHLQPETRGYWLKGKCGGTRWQQLTSGVYVFLLLAESNMNAEAYFKHPVRRIPQIPSLPFAQTLILSNLTLSASSLPKITEPPCTPTWQLHIPSSQSQTSKRDIVVSLPRPCQGW